MKPSEKAPIAYIETNEQKRLNEARETGVPWKKWGPYLSERQWGTVREDYSQDGNAWGYFNHDQARSRAYRWGEDGLAGISDDKQQLCFAIALWNGRDPILKERLFGLTNSEGNHGEDVKEYYFYLDSTPTHSYMKYLYKYPQGEFPYETSSRRTGSDHAKNWNMNCWTLGYLMPIDISISSSNTLKEIPKTFSSRSQFTTAAPNRRSFISFRRYGFATPGRGKRMQPSLPCVRETTEQYWPHTPRWATARFSVKGTPTSCSRKMSPMPTACGDSRIRLHM